MTTASPPERPATPGYGRLARAASPVPEPLRFLPDPDEPGKFYAVHLDGTVPTLNPGDSVQVDFLGEGQRVVVADLPPTLAAQHPPTDSELRRHRPGTARGGPA